MSSEPTLSDEQRAEPILTPAERDHWNIYTWSEGNWLRRNPGAGNKRLHAEAIRAVDLRLTWLEADHARLVEENRLANIDWANAEAELNDVREGYGRLKDDLRRQVQEMVNRHQREGAEWLEQLAAARRDADTAKGEVTRLVEENRRLAAELDQRQQAIAFGNRLHQKRLERGWSHTDLARKVGCADHSTIRWEALPLPTIPSPMLLTRLAEVLGVTREWLLEGKEHHND